MAFEVDLNQIPDPFKSGASKGDPNDDDNIFDPVRRRWHSRVDT